MRINSVHRAILDNQRAIMLALLQSATAVSTRSLRDRLEITSALTAVPKVKPKRRAPRVIDVIGGGAFMSDVGNQGWPKVKR